MVKNNRISTSSFNQNLISSSDFELDGPIPFNSPNRHNLEEWVCKVIISRFKISLVAVFVTKTQEQPLGWNMRLSQGFKAHSHGLFEPQHWISTLTFDLNTFLFIVEVELESSADGIDLISSTLRWIVNVEIQCWGQMATLKFNVEVLKACKNEPVKIGAHVALSGLKSSISANGQMCHF